MEVGILTIFQNYMGRGDDAEMVRGEMRLAELAEPLGFDKLWPAEHHFTDYSAIPDNIQYLSWLAAKTTTLKLGTGAVIVPWNDPLRVAERITLLDHLSDGRAVLGLGRGLSRTEYHHFQVDMGDEALESMEGTTMPPFIVYGTLTDGLSPLNVIKSLQINFIPTRSYLFL